MGIAGCLISLRTECPSLPHAGCIKNKKQNEILRQILFHISMYVQNIPLLNGAFIYPLFYSYILMPYVYVLHLRSHFPNAVGCDQGCALLTSRNRGSRLGTLYSSGSMSLAHRFHFPSAFSSQAGPARPPGGRS